MIWGEVETLRDIVRIVGEDPAIGHVLVFYDRPPGISGRAAESWEAVEQGILAGAGRERGAGDGGGDAAGAAGRRRRRGGSSRPAWRRWPGCGPGWPWPPRWRRRGRRCAAARDRRGVPCAARGDGRWLAEHEAKALLRARGVPVVGGRLALNEDEAVAAFQELAGPVALKLSAPDVRHKTQIGALALDVRDEAGVREAFRRLGVLVIA